MNRTVFMAEMSWLEYRRRVETHGAVVLVVRSVEAEFAPAGARRPALQAS